MRLGIVDLGTLSLRFDLYELPHPAGAEPLFRHRSMPRLGASLFQTGGLSDEVREQVLAEFRLIAKKASALAADKIIAVGTSALRDAREGSELIEQIKRETGIAVRIISGTDEARLTAKGIFANERGLDSRLLLLDIGGGSTECTFAAVGSVSSSLSLSLGALRLKESAFAGAELPYSPELLAGAQAEIDSALEPLVTYQREFKATQAVGSSGTLRTLERLGLGSAGRPGLIELQAISEFLNRVRSMRREELLTVPGVELSRVDVIIPGALIAERILQRLGISSARISHYSLRHGLLAEETEKLVISSGA